MFCLRMRRTIGVDELARRVTRLRKVCSLSEEHNLQLLRTEEEVPRRRHTDNAGERNQKRKRKSRENSENHAQKTTQKPQRLHNESKLCKRRAAVDVTRGIRKRKGARIARAQILSCRFRFIATVPPGGDGAKVAGCATASFPTLSTTPVVLQHELACICIPTLPGHF